MVTDDQLYATATWGTVPGAAGYNVYVRRFGGTATGFDLGILAAEFIPDTSFTYVDEDTTATIAFLVTAIDGSGTEGLESEVIHFVLAGSQAALDADVYGLDRRLIRTLWRGRRLVGGFDWDGRDATGRRAPRGSISCGSVSTSASSIGGFSCSTDTPSSSTGWGAGALAARIGASRMEPISRVGFIGATSSGNGRPMRLGVEGR